ncbi:MAG: hypothetical protein GY835_28060 [bacterium]|nr:hypothetical protein [bacterium]
MAILVQADMLIDAYQNALAVMLSNGRDARVRGINTLECRNLTIEVDRTSGRMLPHTSINFGTVLLRQLMILSGEMSPQILSTFESSSPGSDASAAFKYGDLNSEGIISGLWQVLKTLRSDPNSRQAVLPVYQLAKKHMPDPITLTVQFLIRDGSLHLTATMRSNDLWNGFLTDVQLLMFLQDLLATALGVLPGSYTHIVGSAHIYTTDLDQACSFRDSGARLSCKSDPPPPSLHAAIDLAESGIAKEAVNYDANDFGCKVVNACSKWDWVNWCVKELQSLLADS